MKNVIQITAFFSLLLFATQAFAQARVLVDTDSDRVAIDGYDPVAFFEKGRPLKGFNQHQVIYKGAVYRFRSEENRVAFQEEPEKYEPQYGGFCAVSLSEDTLASGDPQKFRIIDNKLYLVHDTAAAKRLDRESVQKADRNWDKVLDEYGSHYEAAGITP